MNPKILDKIKKCLRLAQSSNANEAATAMRQAQKLMEMHGVTTDDVHISEVDSRTSRAGAGKTPPTHLAMLASMVADAFGAEIIYTVGIDFMRDKWVGKFEFYGVDGAGEISGYGFEVLARQLKKHRMAYLAALNKRLKRSTKIRRGDLYAQGWVSAVARQIAPHVRTETERSTLDKYKENRWADSLKDLKPRDSAQSMRNGDADASCKGFQDGKKVNFHQGVRGSRQAAITAGAEA